MTFRYKRTEKSFIRISYSNSNVNQWVVPFVEKTDQKLDFCHEMLYYTIYNIEKLGVLVFGRNLTDEVVMNSVNMLLLQALQASLQRKSVVWDTEMIAAQWKELFTAASAHHVLPMVYEAVIRSPAAQKTDPQFFAAVKQQTMRVVMMQTMNTAAFLKLLPVLMRAGVTPLVVKGIVCRELYPNPDSRFSGDEDLLIPESQFAVCHEIMLANGMELLNPEQDLNEFEISYGKKGSTLHIEVHKQLFLPASDAYGEFNRFFENAHGHAVTHNVQDVQVPSLNHTDHLFYLICHSFKHFLHSGFGIRQVCDICLYANAFGAEIDWHRILTQCEEIHADHFAAALFRIGEKYLTFQPDLACYPERWKTLEVDEAAMLEDLLASGVFGGSSMSRKHSSTMTLYAVSARKKGKKGVNIVLETVFPSAKDLQGRYLYLKEKPYLLPFAWMDRFLKYRQEISKSGSGNNAAESIRIGNERVELLKQYGIIDS